jgi:hypothetical protein
LNPTVYSGEGSISVVGDTIYFFDPIIGTIHTFDIHGKLLQRHLGYGKGPMELEAGKYHTILSNGQHIFLSDFGYWIHNKSFEKNTFLPIDWNCNISDMEALEKKPDPDNPCIYYFKWGLSMDNSSIIEIDNQRVLVPITTEHEKLNAFQHTQYYKDTYLFAIQNIRTGNTEKLIVKRPANIIKKGLLPNFDLAFAAVKSNNEIVITHATEGILNVYDTLGKVIFGFGIEGKEINNQYTPTASGDYEEIEAQGDEERLKFGWYTGLYLDRNSGYILRSYYKGNMEMKDKWGLQIYDDSYTLIGDISLPTGMRIVGKIGDTYIGYPQLLDETTPPCFLKIRLIK